MSTPKLISFTVCPYVQRAVLALEEKGVEYEVEFIDLGNKPQWFLDISPRGKVPVLIDDGVALFESQAIVEYLDETRDRNRLAPADAKQRARDRAWFSYASEEIYPSSWKAETAGDAEALDAAVATVRSKLELVEEALDGRDWMSGDGSAFGLADVGFAPPLYRFGEWKRSAGVDVLQGLPRVVAWSERMLARDTMARSVPASWREDLVAMGRAMGTHLSTLMA